MQDVFRWIVRIVFLFAFVAFLSASISHVAVFFHNFEQDTSNWLSPYMLAVSIDLTALVLTIGVMFFRKEMPWYAVAITWLFIIGLTCFSWVVNWEYARTYQGVDLKAGHFLSMANPVLASAFAFLNLAYSFVSEFFNTKVKTAEELQAELDRLEGMEALQNRLRDYHERNRKPSLIQRAKQAAMEAKNAAKEVLGETAPVSSEEASGIECTSANAEQTDGSQTSVSTEVETTQETEQVEEESTSIDGTRDGTEASIEMEQYAEPETDPEVEVLNIIQFRQRGSSDGTAGEVKEEVKASATVPRQRKSLTVSEAATFLGCTERYIRDLRRKGTLVQDGNDRLTLASLKSYKKKRTAKTGQEGA